jgi:hypothetical protein
MESSRRELTENLERQIYYDLMKAKDAAWLTNNTILEMNRGNSPADRSSILNQRLQQAYDVAVKQMIEKYGISEDQVEDIRIAGEIEDWPAPKH